MLDGTNLVHRAFYGVRLFSNSEGLFTNAIYGFANTLIRLLDEEKPDGICVALDSHAPTFRAQKYADYKGHRESMDDELRVQMPFIPQLLDAMNIPHFALEGYEADDILGTLSRLTAESGSEAVVVTGDKDMLQLVGENVRVKLVITAMGQTKTTDYTPEVFFAEYGFTPEKMIDYKALMGDPSDNISGVAGIGKKTAGDLVSRFGTVKDIYRDPEALDIKPAVLKKLEAGRESAELSYELAEIDRFMPLDLKLESLVRRKPDNEVLYTLLLRLEFKSIIDKLGLKSQPSGAVQTTEIAREIVYLDSENWKNQLGISDITAIVAKCGLGAFALCTASKTLLAFERNFSTESYSAMLSQLFSGETPKICHDIKPLYLELLALGIEPRGFVADTALAAYLLDPTAGKYSLEKVALSLLHRELPDSRIFHAEESFGALSAAGDGEDAIFSHAVAIFELWKKLKPEIERLEMSGLYYDLELPLCLVLAKMERTGMRVDRENLVEFGAALSERITRAERAIYLYSGTKFNINSTKMLGELLFDKLGLPTVKKTKTGYSTDIEVLEKLKGRHPIIEEIIEYRMLTKLKSTYCDGLLKVIGQDGRIHSSFNMMATTTGRLSSTEPNLQNIPVRKDLGSELRRMFVADKGCVFVDADYSQIELRVLAHIADDKSMIEAFRHGDDIHTITASQVFGVTPEQVTSELRRRAKAVNFGIVYGISDFSLADDLGVTRAEAKSYIENYLAHYSGIKNYMESVVAEAKDRGFVTTLMNRRRYLPELSSKNFNIRSFGERAAMNTPIQGSAADIIKLAMLRVSERLEREKLTARLILQVHDELIVECPESEIELVKSLLTEEMSGVMQLSVPLTAEAKSGKTWYDAK